MDQKRPDDEVLRRLCESAIGGDSAALEELVVSIRNDVYRLALRMVWDEAEAEDATQEILTKIVTKLESFAGRSAFRTWYFRVATNHLLDRRRTPFEALTFSALGDDLLDGLADPSPHYQPELEVLATEVMRNCTRAMLQCLDRNARVAYLLGDVLDLPGPTAAAVLQIDVVRFRQRLARARSKVRGFMTAHCGLVNDEATCRCERRVDRAVELGRIRPSPDPSGGPIEKAMADIDKMQRITALMRSTVDEVAPGDLGATLRMAIENSPSISQSP
ncbi:MAG: RNA polymerase sigma factor [Actinomycetota bacterium]